MRQRRRQTTEKYQSSDSLEWRGERYYSPKHHNLPIFFVFRPFPLTSLWAMAKHLTKQQHIYEREREQVQTIQERLFFFRINYNVVFRDFHALHIFHDLVFDSTTYIYIVSPFKRDFSFTFIFSLLCWSPPLALAAAQLRRILWDAFLYAARLKEQHNRVSSSLSRNFSRLFFTLDRFSCVWHTRKICLDICSGRTDKRKKKLWDVWLLHTARTSRSFFFIYVSTVGGDDEETTSRRSSRDDEMGRKEEANTTRRDVWRMRGRWTSECYLKRRRVVKTNLWCLKR